MNKLFELKGYLSKFYTKYTRYVDKTIQFLLALLTFTFINQNIGFSDVLSNPITAMALSLICTFLPITMTVVIAVVVTLTQLYMLAPGIAIVSGMLIMFMYALYLRFTPKRALLLLMVPIAFMFRIPVVIPIVFGLIGSPVCIIPVSMGTIIYFMINYVKSFGTLLGTVAEAGMMEQISSFAQQLFLNREMWNTIIAFAICLLLVYQLRRMAVDHSWEIAIVAGALANLIVMALGNVMMDINLSYVNLIVGSVVAVIVAFIVEFFIFSVDYSRTEYLQFEDDEYYYYVKAVPKLSVAAPEKTVKRINERQETETIDVEEVRSKEVIQEQKRIKEQMEESEIQKIIEEELRN